MTIASPDYSYNMPDPKTLLSITTSRRGIIREAGMFRGSNGNSFIGVEFLFNMAIRVRFLIQILQSILRTELALH